MSKRTFEKVSKVLDSNQENVIQFRKPNFFERSLWLTSTRNLILSLRGNTRRCLRKKRDF